MRLIRKYRKLQQENIILKETLERIATYLPDEWEKWPAAAVMASLARAVLENLRKTK